VIALGVAADLLGVLGVRDREAVVRQ